MIVKKHEAIKKLQLLVANYKAGFYNLYNGRSDIDSVLHGTTEDSNVTDTVAD